MKVIQLRGTNATGKTTAMREFILRGNFQPKQFLFRGEQIDYHWDERRKIAVLGRYDDRMTGGIDGRITNKALLIDVIVRIMKQIKPDALLFEGIVYGVTYQFGFELNAILKKIGAEYIGLCFIPDLQTAFERLAERNGGKPVDYLSVQNKWFTASRAYERLLSSGVNVKQYDTSKIPKADMYKLIEAEL